MSKNFEKVKTYYNNGIWSKERVRISVPLKFINPYGKNQLTKTFDF